MSGPPASPGAPPPADPSTLDTEPDSHDVARAIVLRQLTGSPKSRAQLEQVLRRRNCPDDVAAAVLDRMEAVGLVDDRAYAEMLVRSRQAGKGLARRALEHELHSKGVDRETAAAALEGLDVDRERDRARELAAKKLRTMAGLDAQVQARRLAGMLARKGYSSELVRQVVDEAITDAPEHQRD